MLPTVEDIHHRNWQCAGSRSSEIAIKRLTRGLRGRTSNRQGDSQESVSSQAPLVRSSIQFDHGLVHADLIERVQPKYGFGNLLVDMAHRVANALAAVAVRIVVSQFNGFVGSR